MANTTNFNWETPDDTDLVKDGAAAIRTLGSAIDTSLVDLKGGTTGQVLSKATNTDMDFTWVAQDDSNAIQNAIVDAKGDLISATAADTPARLAVGANGTVLTADSAEATGLKWVAPASGSTYSGVAVKKTAAQSIANATFTAATWDSEDYDTDTYHDNSTNNSRITIPTGKSGYFLLSGTLNFDANATGNRGCELRKNGSGVNYVYFLAPTTAANEPAIPFSFVINATAGDYLELFVYQTSGGALNMNSASSKWQVSFLGA